MVGSETPKIRETSLRSIPRSQAASIFSLRSFEYGFMTRVSHTDQPSRKPLSAVGTYIARARPVLARAHAVVPPELPAEVVRRGEADLSGNGADVVHRMLQEPGRLAQAE